MNRLGGCRSPNLARLDPGDGSRALQPRRLGRSRQAGTTLADPPCRPRTRGSSPFRPAVADSGPAGSLLRGPRPSLSRPSRRPPASCRQPRRSPPANRIAEGNAGGLRVHVRTTLGRRQSVSPDLASNMLSNPTVPSGVDYIRPGPVERPSSSPGRSIGRLPGNCLAAICWVRRQLDPINCRPGRTAAFPPWPPSCPARRCIRPSRTAAAPSFLARHHAIVGPVGLGRRLCEQIRRPAPVGDKGHTKRPGSPREGDSAWGTSLQAQGTR